MFLTLDGRFRGRMDGPRSPTGELQIAQARFLSDPARALRSNPDGEGARRSAARRGIRTGRARA